MSYNNILISESPPHMNLQTRTDNLGIDIENQFLQDIRTQDISSDYNTGHMQNSNTHHGVVSRSNMKKLWVHKRDIHHQVMVRKGRAMVMDEWDNFGSLDLFVLLESVPEQEGNLSRQLQILL